MKTLKHGIKLLHTRSPLEDVFFLLINLLYRFVSIRESQYPNPTPIPN